jgi:RNA polymerase sigma factor (sigma-70 family)
MTTFGPPLFQTLQPLPIGSVKERKTKIGRHSNYYYTDIAIIDGLKVQNIGVINYLYIKFYNPIRNMVKFNSGTEMDAEDLFQETLIVIYQKISNNSLTLLSSFYTYLYSICWHIWLKKLKKRSYTYEYKDISELEAWENEMKMSEIIKESNKYELFLEHFLKLNNSDQKVLNLYMCKTSSKEIANLMGYSSGNYAKLRKYLCKEKLKSSIINDPRFKILSQS